MNTRLIHITDNAERHMAYCARVSSPNQENPEFKKLLSFCIAHKHWSVFEMANMCVEITTSRAIAQQILRHRSFHFQEFSQRYAEATEFELYGARRQDTKDRQNSVDDLSDADKAWFLNAQEGIQRHADDVYREAIKRGIAKEQARFLLPISVVTKLYMSGTVRDWIHYLAVRTTNGTQREHMDIAKSIQNHFIKELPVTSEALRWR